MARKKRRAAAKSNTRSIAGVSLELLNKKKTEKPEVRQASREAAIREIKVRDGSGLTGSEVWRHRAAARRSRGFLKAIALLWGAGWHCRVVHGPTDRPCSTGNPSCACVFRPALLLTSPDQPCLRSLFLPVQERSKKAKADRAAKKTQNAAQKAAPKVVGRGKR